MSTRLLVRDGAIEFLVGSQSMGSRRHVDDADEEFFVDCDRRYDKLVRQSGDASAGLLSLGKDLYEFLDGDDSALTKLRGTAPKPLVLEIQGSGSPSDTERAILRAPFELLADEEGYLAQNELTRFSVVRRLGEVQEPDPLGDFRFGMAFMASAPRGVSDLDFEREETAILQAVGRSEIDLYVDESGDPKRLASQLKDLKDDLPVVHLSCHGHDRWRPKNAPDAAPQPALLMENEFGDLRPTPAAELTKAFSVAKPRMVFLSACLTASSKNGDPASGGGEKDAEQSSRTPIAHSLATALIEGGTPAVIGWDGSVKDVAATKFAQALYERLAAQEKLEVALGDARRALLNDEDHHLRGDWHLARLWLGSTGGGPLANGSTTRKALNPDRTKRTFLAKEREEVPVADPEMFVGRRRPLQEALRTLDGATHSGVLLHGMGRLGKSSLASRIANRLPEFTPAVVFQHYDPLSILEAIRSVVAGNQDARDLIRTRTDEVRNAPERLEDLLIDLLSGPCDRSANGSPILLVIDDLERILESDGDGNYRLKADHAPTMTQVLRAFELADTASRLVFTSRYLFSLDGLEQNLHPIQLPPLSDAAQTKLQYRQREAGNELLSNALSADELAKRKALADQVPAVAQGNPGLHDLIAMKLVYSSELPFEKAETAIAEMRAYLGKGDLPETEELREFLEGLTIDTLLEEAGTDGRALLQAGTLFELPVPKPIMGILAEATGGSIDRLRGLGLIDPFEDLINHTTTALLPNALVAARTEALTDDQATTYANAVTRELFLAWGGATPKSRRPRVADFELTRLGLMIGEAEVVAGSAAGAVQLLLNHNARAALDLGEAAYELAMANGVDIPLGLYQSLADAATTAGEGEKVDAWLAEATAALSKIDDADLDPFEAGGLALRLGRRHQQRGEMEAALGEFERARGFFEDAGIDRDAAIAQGNIANIHMARGELDEALRIRTERELPVYEGLGDVRSEAVAWADIADIHRFRGELDESLRIRMEECLPVFERLGEVREEAVTWAKIADIHQARGELDEALRIRTERELPVFERAGNARDAAIAQGKIADIHMARGEFDDALRIYTKKCLPVFERLGDVREKAFTWSKIADIHMGRGELDEALTIRTEKNLPVFKGLGDVRSEAVTWGKIADIHMARGELDESLRIRMEECLPVFERLSDVREEAVTWSKIADVHEARGELDEALRVRTEKNLPVFEDLGDVRSEAAAWGKIADIHMARGELDEALTIRTEKELPVYGRLGDVRSKAVTWAKIADIHMARGELDESLRIRMEECLPVFERLSDVREEALAWGKIADIHMARGELDEALTIRTERELPVYERLGDVRSEAVTWGQIADIHEARGEFDEALKVRTERELPVLRQVGVPHLTALTLFQIGQLEVQRERLEAALPYAAEAFSIVDEGGITDGVAAIGMIYGQLLLVAGSVDDGVAVLGKSRAAFNELGSRDEANHLADLIRQVKGGDAEEA